MWGALITPSLASYLPWSKSLETPLKQNMQKQLYMLTYYPQANVLDEGTTDTLQRCRENNVHLC